MEPIEFLQWFAGITYSVMAGAFLLWWRIERNQSDRIDRNFDLNLKAHADLSSKIDEHNTAVLERMDRQQEMLQSDHRHLLGKIEELWKAVLQDTDHKRINNG